MRSQQHSTARFNFPSNNRRAFAGAACADLDASKPLQNTSTHPLTEGLIGSPLSVAPEVQAKLNDLILAAVYEIVVELAGVRFAGIQPGSPAHKLEAVIMFDNHHGSTLGLFASQFSLQAVRARVSESDAAFEAAYWLRHGANDPAGDSYTHPVL